jgi:hypothetical protein
VNSLHHRSHLWKDDDDDNCTPQQQHTVKLTVALSRPSFKTDKVAGENKEMSKWVDKYLGVGEWVMDQSVAIAGSSGWFERTR